MCLKKIRGTVSDEKPLATALSVGTTEFSAEVVPQSRPLLAGIARLPTGGRGLTGMPPGSIRGADARPIGLGKALGHLVGRVHLLGPRRLDRHRRSSQADQGEQPQQAADEQSDGPRDCGVRDLEEHEDENKSKWKFFRNH